MGEHRSLVIFRRTGPSRSASAPSPLPYTIELLRMIILTRIGKKGKGKLSQLAMLLREQFLERRRHAFFRAGGHPAPVAQVAVAFLYRLFNGNVARSAFAVAHHHDERVRAHFL